MRSTAPAWSITCAACLRSRSGTRKTRQLLLGRDRLGIKPLYYASSNEGVIFASEIKPILQCRGVDRALDWGAVGHLFTFLATPSSTSIVVGHQEARTGAHRRRHRRPAAANRTLLGCPRSRPMRRSSEGELVERLRALLDESVALHQRLGCAGRRVPERRHRFERVVATIARATSDRR